MTIILQWIAGALEALLGIPILGGTIVIGFAYIPLGVMLLIPIATLIVVIREQKEITPSIVGIATSVVD